MNTILLNFAIFIQSDKKHFAETHCDASLPTDKLSLTTPLRVAPTIARLPAVARQFAVEAPRCFLMNFETPLIIDESQYASNLFSYI